WRTRHEPPPFARPDLPARRGCSKVVEYRWLEKTGPSRSCRNCCHKTGPPTTASSFRENPGQAAGAFAKGRCCSPHQHGNPVLIPTEIPEEPIYMWGLDLDGGRSATGGVGGLLAVTAASETS